MFSKSLPAGIHRPAACPEGWEVEQLGSLCSTLAGGRLGLTKQKDYQSVGVPAFSAAGQDGFVDKAEFFSTEGVVLSAIGAQCGKCFLATGDWTTLANTQAIIPGESLDARFLYYRVNRDDYWPRSGSAQPFIKPSSIGKCWISLPPLPEQQLIASILDTVDEVIRKTEEVIAKLQQMKQGLLHDLLTRGIDDNGELRDPDRHPEQFKDSELGRIPKDWEAPELGEGIGFITDYRGITPPYSDEGIQVISAENVGNGRIKSITKYVTEEVDRRTSTRGHTEPGDTIFTTEAPVAEVAQVPAGRVRLTRRVIGLRPKPDYWEKDFLYWFMFHLSDAGAWDSFTHGSTVPRILKPDILGRAIARPPLPEQRHMVTALNSQRDRTTAEQAELAKLRLLKSGLMDDLLTGRVRVTDLLPTTTP